MARELFETRPRLPRLRWPISGRSSASIAIFRSQSNKGNVDRWARVEHARGVTSEAFLEGPQMERGVCRGCPEIEHHTSTKPYDSHFFIQFFSMFFFSTYGQSSGHMASTHIYRPMEMAPFTVIPFIPNSQKPFNRSIYKPPSKSSIRQPTPLNVSQAIVLGELSSATLSGGNSWLKNNPLSIFSSSRHYLRSDRQLGSSPYGRTKSTRIHRP